MSETGDFESFSAPAAKESSEQSDEQFREQMAAAQAAMQALKKEEGQARAQDDNIAKIIVGFLNDGHTDLFLLISRCVGQNIPSEIILAVLSLVDQRSSDELAGFLSADHSATSAPKEAHEAAASALAKRSQGHFGELSPQQKKEIDEWVNRITTVAMKRPHRALESLVTKSLDERNNVVREINLSFLQLSAFIMRNYFSSHSLNFEFDELYAFMQSVYVELLKHLSELAAGQKKLGGE